MNPYVEQLALSLFHTRLIVAIADAIEPQLSSHHYVHYYVYVNVETRIYQSDESDEELLIGIPAAIAFVKQADRSSQRFPP